MFCPRIWYPRLTPWSERQISCVIWLRLGNDARSISTSSQSMTIPSQMPQRCHDDMGVQLRFAVSQSKSSGVTWDEATLDKFIENPDQVIPNNNMKPYKGIADSAVRKQIVDFLKSQSARP
jgi:hypothetical protein